MKEWLRPLHRWAAALPLPPPDRQSGGILVRLHDPKLSAAGMARLLTHLPDSGIVIAAADNSAAESLAASLAAFLPLFGEKRAVIPVPEVSSGRRQWQPDNEAGLSAALQAALSGEKAIFIAGAATLIARTLPPSGFARRSFTLKCGQTISLTQLRKNLVSLDYDNETEVNSPGEFSCRGGIVDIFSPLYPDPVRIEFWGDEIETIRFFSAATQRSTEEIKQVRIVPQGNAMLQTAPEATATVRDYFDRELPLILCDSEAIRRHLAEYGDSDDCGRWDALLSSTPRRIAVEPTPLVQNDEAAADKPETAVDADAIALGEELSPALENPAGGALALWHWQQLRNTMLRWRQSGYTLVACCNGAGELERFQELLRQDPACADLRICTEHLALPQGVLFPRQRLVLLSDQEIFGRTPVRRRRRHIDYHYEQAAENLLDLEVGGYAVHVNYGICRYHGIHLKSIDGETIEAIELEFADAERIFVPLEQSFLVSRYVGGSKSTPALSALNSNRWRNARERARKAAWDLAAEMLKMEAVRAASPGFRFQPSPDWERAFAASFPYDLTPDQQSAVEACFDDMASPKPMDRLLCGDVGYGKTEVALRAAFRAVMNGKQVALLVPTTILAQQHYQTFTARLREFPISVGMLSRFCPPAEQRRTAAQIADGSLDIVIGTHRLLSKDIHFANPGLLIIDEEQRFGVKHKQRLKAMRSTLDVLTMSATPVPRTLYLSLAGLRNLSTISTPPQNRLPVSTVVANDDNELIRRAIRREMERGGQTFVLHNRVHSIEKYCQRLQALVPEARFAIAHGQMSPDELEQIMTSFVAGQYDVLVSTTIVESGIDIPNANTIIVDRSDRFGLSELYQLRGRVGRTYRQAYAYMLMPPMGVLPANAKARLAAIKRFSHLGAGLRLAMKDLEIRGAGNLLGQEQSGHIAAVGFELYCQLLKESVARLQKGGARNFRQITFNLEMVTSSLTPVAGKVQSCLPPEYIEDEPTRINLYRRLQALSTPEEVRTFGEELRDRFGPLPTAVQRLLQYHRIKCLAASADFFRLETANGRLFLESPRGLWRNDDGDIPRLPEDSPAAQLDAIEKLVNCAARKM